MLAVPATLAVFAAVIGLGTNAGSVAFEADAALTPGFHYLNDWS